MIVDFHTHIFPERIAPSVLQKLQHLSRSKPYTQATAHSLRSSMEHAEISLSVILPVATNAAQPEKLNTVAAELCERTDQTGLLSFGAMHPDAPNMRQELARCVQLGLKGIKIHPAYQEADLDDLRFLRLIDRASELGLIVVTHAGWDIGIPQRNYATPAQIRRVMNDVHPNKFVAAHMGGWRDWNAVSEQLAGLPLWFDTAFSIGTIEPAPGTQRAQNDCWQLRDAEFVRLVRKHGAQRILFATDSPWADQSDFVRRIRKMDLTEEERTAIFSGNAQALLGL